VWLAPPLAWGDGDDATLTVIVNRDLNRDNAYDAADPPEPGIEITVSDAGGRTVQGLTDSNGRYVLERSPELTGGLYFVVAEIPAELSDLAPVTDSETFAPLSTTVDVSTESQTVRMGVALKPAPTDPPAKTTSPPEEFSSDSAHGGPDQPPKFAVGDMIWRDADRSGTHQPSEPEVPRISVQLLNDDGKVIESTVSSSAGRYTFDDLAAGTYSIRFAGIPAGFRLAPSRSGGDRDEDSDPDYTGVTPPFTLGVGEPNVRRATAADGVDAAYVNPSIDAGITALRYAIGDRVWHDLNSDGLQQAGEPPSSAKATLLRNQTVVASTATDDRGRYMFAGLPAGTYEVMFTGLPPNRTFTTRGVGSNPSLDSDADPRTGISAEITLGPGAANLVPAGDLGVATADFVDPTVNAGLVGVYSLGDTVWRDGNGNGVRDPGDAGVAKVDVQLLNGGGEVLTRTVTSATGRFTFDGLPAGPYQLQFGHPPTGLRFTTPQAGTNPAVDSDADGTGRTRVLVLGDENPTDTTIDAGLTTPASFGAAPVPAGAAAQPVVTRLSSTGGVPPHLLIGGVASSAVGVLCLAAARPVGQRWLSRIGSAWSRLRIFGRN
jgi:protocatechuate 3,4-dioxygenase beta subunit